MVFNVATPRMLRARELTEDADKLHENQRETGAVLLYLSALEMIGWEVLDQSGISKDELPAAANKKGKPTLPRLHQIRHFAAASILLIDSLRYELKTVDMDLDFSKIQVNRKEIIKDGKPCTQWDIMALSPDMHNLLEPMRRMQEVSKMNVESLLHTKFRALDFHRRAALGFLDNFRLSILHHDNKFTYTQSDLSGTTRHSKDPDLAQAATEQSLAHSYIWRSFEEPTVMEVVQSHIRPMLVSFAPLLTSNSYHENT